MIALQSSLTPILLSILILLFLGLSVFTWGEKLPGKGSWLLWAGILLVISGVGFDSGLLLKEEFKIKVWMTGWIWPREDLSAITVGIFQDPLNLSMILLTILVAALTLMNQSFLCREPRPEKVHAGIAISAAGVAVSWISITPWLGLAGLALSLIGGFILFGSRWDSNFEAKVAIRFIGEKSGGLLLALMGASILTSAHTALIFNHSASWMGSGELASSAWIGSILLVMGLFIQMQTFPLIGGLVPVSELYPPLRTLLNQVFPAWAAFGLLVKLEPELIRLGLFPGFGWIALISTLLTVLSGLFQDRWRQGVGLWLSSGYSLSCAFLAFSGPRSAMSLFLGVSLGSLCVSNAATSLEGGCSYNPNSRKRAIWIKLALFLGTAAGSGVVGFVSATGGLQWISKAMELTGGMVALFLFVLFLFVLLGWKNAWKISKLSLVTDVSWATVISQFACILLSLGFFWTGCITGDVLLGAPDRLVSSGFDVFFGPLVVEVGQSEAFLTASGLYWGTLILALFTSYYLVGRKVDQWELLSRAIPKTKKFLAFGYGIDELVLRMMALVLKAGHKIELFVDYKVWMQWMPHSLNVGIKILSNNMSGFDEKMSYGIRLTLLRVVEVPAKILQLIQTGDVRWYLFFALSSGFAVLLHFLKI